ncbi:nuclear transcription factor Y subunit gamma-like protein [Dinothrombium tinctorium]|uniref:Nuclear transcription factor Y subunit gamma n=1 Tax=Dinothrombium tinctorium TaxID=1965070 RepID=A0A3S3PC10_9ACAR|nr:nuclear transcription factor Y subunit gamma-like protein [Dinothrombium tinctorium]RWS17026.1 nuclear transcription factor Y subunit gamma-like protein [Dinothrombium tinctorium]
MSQDSTFSAANSETAIGGSSSNSLGSTEAQQMLDSFWQRTLEDIKNLGNNDFKNQELPLARIKKIMKLDDDVKVMMISAEAPVLFAKAAEIFITEISLRAWIHTEDNKRRTLQRNDIAMAITKYDQFDFLIDIVPRDELKPNKRQQQAAAVAAAVGGVTVDPNNPTAQVTPDQIQYYLQLAQQHQTVLQQQGTSPGTQNAGQTPQILTFQAAPNSIAGTNPGQAFALSNASQLVQVQVPNTSQSAAGDGSSNNGQHSPVNQTPVLQIAGQAVNAGTNQNQAQNTASGQIQIVQPVITSNGELVQQIPIQLSPAQLQLIRMQLQGQASPTQPIILQAAPISQTTVSGTPQYQITTAGGQQFLTQTVVSGGATAGANVEGEGGDQLEDEQTSEQS